MVTPTERAAARGILKIAAQELNTRKRAILAYIGTYACGYQGRGDLAKYYAIGSSSSETLFVSEVAHRAGIDRSTAYGIVTGWNTERVSLDVVGIRAYVKRSTTPAQLAVGDIITTVLPMANSGLSPGFLVRRGEQVPGQAEMSRLYINIRPRHAAWALGALATVFDHKSVAFEIKALAHPRAYLRRDACVVYVRSQQAEEAADLICSQTRLASVRLEAGVPLFTKTIAPGVGLADEPSDIQPSGLSHGQWVSRLYMSAIESASTVNGVAEAVQQLVANVGRDPSHPYLRSSTPRFEGNAAPGRRPDPG